MNLPPTVYGSRTASLERAIATAERVRLFEPPRAGFEIGLRAVVDRHVAQMELGGGKVPPTVGIRITEGSVTEFVADWAIRGERWRSAVDQLIVELRSRCENRERAKKLRPPLWPLEGNTGVVGAVFVATGDAEVRCRKKAKSKDEQNAAWKAIVQVEKWLDALLLAELYADVERANPFESILDICGRGLIPLGWDDGTFWVFRFNEL